VTLYIAIGVYLLLALWMVWELHRAPNEEDL
jgi:hypothetical protein